MGRGCIVMVGTSLATRGGISAVLNAYRDHGLFDRWPIVYLCSHVEGNFFQKVRVAVSAFLTFALFLARRASIVHVHSSSHASFWRKSVFVAVARFMRTPVLFHLHGGGFIDFYENRAGGPIGRYLIRTVLRKASCIVVLSEYWKMEIEKIVPTARVVSVCNPVSAPRSPTVARDRRAGQILFLGKVCAEKGVDDLLAAFSNVARSFPHAVLEIGGDGELDALKRKVSEYALQGSVNVHGWVSGDAKARLLAQSNIFVLPSHAEGMPMAILEGMQYGLAIIATRVGSVPEVVTHGEQGLLIEPRRIDQLIAALQTLLSHEQLCREMGARAQQKVNDEFSPAVVLPAIGNLYRELAMVDLECRAGPVIGASPDDPT